MIVITLHRKKCIGCNYCVEAAPERWRMSKKDGKCHLLGSSEKRGFYTVKVGDEELDENLVAKEACPVKVIQVKVV